MPRAGLGWEDGDSKRRALPSSAWDPRIGDSPWSGAQRALRGEQLWTGGRERVEASCIGLGENPVPPGCLTATSLLPRCSPHFDLYIYIYMASEDLKRVK